MSGRRTLHFVFKIGDRTKSVEFFKNNLGMKVLRHEEFDEGCKATCNGPYDGKWSKTMIGYGSEDTHFVCELTYNYGIGQYALGNDFMGMTIKSAKAVENCKSSSVDLKKVEENLFESSSPDGYKFFLRHEAQPTIDPVEKVTLASSNLSTSVKYWTEVAGMKIFKQTQTDALLGYSDDQAKLGLHAIDGDVDHQKAFGRIAIACPREQLEGIQALVKKSGGTILTELVSLETPGKATVEVVILGDPDGHEICFVGDEAFRELSQVDPSADKLLDEAIKADKSNEWYESRKRTKPTA